MVSNFADLLTTDRIILLDGAMGTELSGRGVIAGGQANMEAGEVVCAIHGEYVACGCDAITTNTLTMNRIYIETHKVGVSVEEVNRVGAYQGGGRAAGAEIAAAYANLGGLNGRMSN